MAPTPTNPIRIEGPALARHAASEWVLTNALGGFAMGTVSGVPMRRYHGLLVAPYAGTVKRHVFLSRFEEWFHGGGKSVAMSIGRYPGTYGPLGHQGIERFELAPLPRWTYRFGHATLEREVFPDLRLGLLHGRLAPDEKDRAMQKFKEGLIQVLVATTVVEVGIDVPNANVIVIRNPDRFGLSQLHQLRGRVGRGEHQSFCILVAPEKLTHEGEERLAAMARSDDGFELAQVDFELRGAGEVTGLRQSGASEFRIADLRVHGPLLEKAIDFLSKHEDVRRQFGAMKNIKQTLEKGLVLFGN